MILYDSKKEITKDIRKAWYIETESKKDWNDAIEALGHQGILWTKGERHAPYIYIYKNTTTTNLKGVISDICISSHENFRNIS